MSPKIAFTALALACAAGMASTASARAETLADILKLPDGFSIAPYATVPGARSMALARELGVLFVSTRADTVYAVPLSDDDGLRPTYPVLTGLKVANAVAWKDGHLYVAEQHRLTRYFVPSLDALPGAEPEVLFEGFPDKPGHGWRYAAFAPGPNGVDSLYVGVGAPCNVCTTQDIEGTIVRFDPPAFARPTIVASGVRNTVGFDVNPRTGALTFTDNGVDGMGDDSPPDELNALALDQTDGAPAFFGFPYYGGGTHRTPQMGLIPAPETRFPIVEFQAHVAPLGIDFYAGDAFPSEYRDDAFVAQHGSWNRSSKVGYQVVRVTFDKEGNATGYTPFITGWLQPDGLVLGRPVDLEELPDGSLLVSDDKAGRVWRVTYEAP